MQRIHLKKNAAVGRFFSRKTAKAASRAKFTCIINVFVILTNYFGMHLFFSKSDSNILASKDES